METTIIDLRPKVKKYNGNGRQMLADVHFRIDIPEYSRALNDHSQEAREAEQRAVTAFDNEVVQLLLADGWTLRKEDYGPGACPQLTKGAQYLYCHPHDISGQVNPTDVERMEQMFRSMKSIKYRWTDNYGDIIVTTSEEDERSLYREYYPAGLATTLCDLLTTKRKNLYKDKGSAEHAACNRICIQNRRIDLDEIGTGFPHMRRPVVDFVVNEWERLKALGYIREADGANGQQLARWANKAEQREIENKMKLFREEWRYVINEVSNVYDEEDLPSFLTLGDAMKSNRLHSEPYVDERTGEVLENPTHILYSYCKNGDAGTCQVAYGVTEEQALQNHRRECFGLSYAESTENEQ